MKECCQRLSRIVYWQLFTGLSGQLVGPIFKVEAFFSHCFILENGKDRLHQKSIHDYQHTPRSSTSQRHSANLTFRHFKKIEMWKVRASNPSWGKGFVRSRRRQNRLWDQPNFLYNGFRNYFRGVGRSGHEVDQASKPNVETKNRWSCTSTSPVCFHSAGRGNYFLFSNFVVLLTVHLSIFTFVINQHDAQNLFYNKFISCLYMFRAPCVHRQEVREDWLECSNQSSLNLCTGRPPIGVMIPEAV